MTQELADTLLTDASDAPQRLGAESSAIYDNLAWALEVKQSLDAGMAATIRELQAHRNEIRGLPESGAPGALREAVSDDLAALSDRVRKEDFYRYYADFSSQLTHMKACVRDAARDMTGQQKKRLQEGVEDLQRLPEWAELTQEERVNAVSRLDGLELRTSEDLAGLKKLVALNFDINSRLEDLKGWVQRLGQERIRTRIEEQVPPPKEQKPGRLRRSIMVPVTMTSAADIDELIRELEEIKAQISSHESMEVSIVIGEARARAAGRG